MFPVGRGLQTDFGKFASNLGFETNYAKDNNHFSRVYLFNFLPFYHSGLRLSLPVHDKVTVMYMLTNGIQQTEDFNDFKSNHFTAIVKPVDAVAWTVNYYFGQEQPDGGEPGARTASSECFDTYATYAATPALSFGVDVNYVTNEVDKTDDALSLQGTGLYARYQVTEPAAVALRYERLDDEGLFGGIDQVLHGLTASAEYKFADGFLVRGEFRRDWSNQSVLHRLRARRSPRAPEHIPGRPGVVVRQQARRLVTAMLDLAFVGLSILFFIAGAAYVAGCRRLE